MTASLRLALAFSAGVIPAHAALAGTCDGVDDALLDRPEHDAAVWPTLLACARERFATLSPSCLATARGVSADATSGWGARAEVRAGAAGAADDRSAARREAMSALESMEAERSAATAKGARDLSLPGTEVAADELTRLQAAGTSDVLAWGETTPGPAGCSASEARLTADLFDRVIAAMPRIEDQVSSQDLCSIYADGAAARVWAHRPGVGPMFQTSAGLFGAACDPEIAQLTADPRVAVAAIGAVRATAAAEASWLIRPPDADQWWVDGSALPDDDQSGRLPLSAGVHRIGHEGEPLQFAMVDVPPGSDLRVSVDDGRIIAIATPLSDPLDGALSASAGQVRLVRLGVGVGAARQYDATFGTAALSLQVAHPTLPIALDVRGRVAVTTEPIWIRENEPVDHLLRAEVGVSADLWRKLPVAPVASLVLFRDSALSWGVTPTLAARLDTRWSTVEASIGLPMSSTGPEIGVEGALTLRAGSRVRSGAGK